MHACGQHISVPLSMPAILRHSGDATVANCCEHCWLTHEVQLAVGRPHLAADEGLAPLYPSRLLFGGVAVPRTRGRAARLGLPLQCVRVPVKIIFGPVPAHSCRRTLIKVKIGSHMQAAWLVPPNAAYD